MPEQLINDLEVLPQHTPIVEEAMSVAPPDQRALYVKRSLAGLVVNGAANSHDRKAAHAKYMDIHKEILELQQGAGDTHG